MYQLHQHHLHLHLDNQRFHQLINLVNLYFVLVLLTELILFFLGIFFYLYQQYLPLIFVLNLLMPLLDYPRYMIFKSFDLFCTIRPID
ncbi:MAG: hypothetical protein CBB70_13735, partial [Planctomycetaceae bacterium TMED10]